MLKIIMFMMAKNGRRPIMINVILMSTGFSRSLWPMVMSNSIRMTLLFNIVYINDQGNGFADDDKFNIYDNVYDKAKAKAISFQKLSVA